jgi:hypothetical protein
MKRLSILLLLVSAPALAAVEVTTTYPAGSTFNLRVNGTIVKSPDGHYPTLEAATAAARALGPTVCTPGACTITQPTATVTVKDIPPPACIYRFSEYSPTTCPQAGKRTRVVIASEPTPCTASPTELEQPCKYEPPAPPAPAKPSATISFNPPVIAPNESSTVTWSSANAASCTITSGGQSQAVAANGSAPTPKVMQTLTASIVCTGAGGSASASGKLTVTPPVVPPPTTKTPYDACLEQPWIDVTVAYTWGQKVVRIPRDCSTLKPR